MGKVEVVTTHINASLDSYLLERARQVTLQVGTTSRVLFPK